MLVGARARRLGLVSLAVPWQNVPNWHRDIVRVCENIPIVLVGNKAGTPPVVRRLQGPSCEFSLDLSKALELPDVDCKKQTTKRGGYELYFGTLY